ncbi:amidase signature enzyme [Thozetella sp. PMI_491]|nr:amidase signature enzyme [Thozetella sp. PMI_491]
MRRKKGAMVFAQAMRLVLCFSITSLARAFSSTPFDPREATVASVRNALWTQSTTCRQVVSSFLARIEAFNPKINAIISLNPEALAVADQLDLQLAEGNATAPLFCIPVLLKDNFDAIGMMTTGGCLALANNQPSEDAPTVAALRNAGAVILGKTNLHEMALEGLSVSSLGGQTINPYDVTRTPGGSSGGTGAAIAASFAIIGTGTDTVNSLRSPASANSLYSFRPTRGLISRAGVIPVSYTQDSVGAIARSLDDLALALTIMASGGLDPADNTTALKPTELEDKDYTVALRGGSLKGVRLGILDGFLNRTGSDETTPVNVVMTSVVDKLTAGGAEIVNITESIYNATQLLTLDTQVYEYRQELDSYLARGHLAGTSRPTTFSELYTSDNFLVIPAQYPYIQRAFTCSTSDAGYSETKQAIRHLGAFLQTTFEAHGLDAIIYPQQKNLVVKQGSPSQSGRNGILAALTGSPVVVVPAGFSPPSEDAPVGVPVGMEILGKPWSEDRLLNIAKHVSDTLGPVRRVPHFATGALEEKAYNHVPIVRPDTGNIKNVYPQGAIGE